MSYHLISAYTCPWVQRAVIILRAKSVNYEVTYIDLRAKPDWFLEISPHGKVPVLMPSRSIWMKWKRPGSTRMIH